MPTMMKFMTCKLFIYFTLYSCRNDNFSNFKNLKAKKMFENVPENPYLNDDNKIDINEQLDSNINGSENKLIKPLPTSRTSHRRQNSSQIDICKFYKFEKMHN